MKYKLYILLITILLLGFSCGDDDDDGIIEVPEADRTEQQVIDNDSLVSYLQSHYVDASLLSNNPTISFTEININQLPDDGELPNPNQNSLLIDIVETLTTTYFDVEYEYYILKINQGGSENSPNFSDKVRVSYEGTLMDDTVFDSSSTPVDFDLTSTIAGWGRVLPEFNIAEDFVINSDGTVTYNNPGIGIMFLPSGLGYYSAAAGSVPVYSNLIFKFTTGLISVPPKELIILTYFRSLVLTSIFRLLYSNSNFTQFWPSFLYSVTEPACNAEVLAPVSIFALMGKFL